MLTGLTFAVAADDPAPNWAAEFYPTTEQIQTVCDDGYLAATRADPDWVSTPHSGSTFDANYSYESMIEYQFPLGATFNQCLAQGSAQEPENPAAPVTWFMTYVHGTVTDVAATSQWTAVIQVTNATGAETARLKFVASLSKFGDPKHWTQDCTKTPCLWTGDVAFYFDLRDPAFRAAILAGGAPSLLVQRGNSQEIFPFPYPIDGK